jgi:hypothetical protein
MLSVREDSVMFLEQYAKERGLTLQAVIRSVLGEWIMTKKMGIVKK